jgi:ketosteroid isomerase-like protein
MMSEEPTPDLVERVKGLVDANSRRDFDAIMSFYAPRAVATGIGTGVYEGHAAIRPAYEDWMGVYEDFDTEAEEVRDLGNGVVFAVTITRGRLPGKGAGWLQVRLVLVMTWADGLIERIANYADIDKGIAAAERLAEERR